MVLRSGLAALAGVVLALAFEPVGASLVLPFAVTAYVLVVRGLGARAAMVPGLFFGVAFCYTLMIWMRAVGTDAWLALSGLEASFYALLGAATAVLLRLRWWPLWVACAWVGMEAIRSSWPFSGMPWGRLAFATAGTPWEQALPYAGMAGVSFLLALLGTTLAWLLTSGRGTRRTPALVAAAVAAAGLVPVLVPWQPTPGEGRTVAVVQGNVPGDGSNVLLDHRQVTRNHVDATIGLADDIASGTEPEPDFVLWPENSTAVDPFLDAEVNRGIEEASDAIGLPIVVGGMVDAGEEHVLNQGIVWDPVTGGGDRYTKRHPVPFGEYIPWRGIFRSNFGRLALIPRDMKSGTRIEPLEVADTLVADAICFDVAYDDGIHDQIGAGGQLLVVQTSNALFIHTDQIDQQFEISRLRALETGRWVLVAAINGVSGVIAPDGTVVAQADPRTQDVLVEEVRLIDGRTPAVVLGPWVGRLGAIAALGALLVARLTYRRDVRATTVDR